MLSYFNGIGLKADIWVRYAGGTVYTYESTLDVAERETLRDLGKLVWLWIWAAQLTPWMRSETISQEFLVSSDCNVHAENRYSLNKLFNFDFVDLYFQC